MEVGILLVSPFGNYWAFQDKLFFNCSISGGGIKIDLSATSHSDKLFYIMNFGQFRFSMISDFDCQNHEIVIDFAVLNF